MDVPRATRQAAAWTGRVRRHRPDNFYVAEAYFAFKVELADQFLLIGRPVVPTDIDPYGGSAVMFAALDRGEPLAVYTVADLPSDHPMAATLDPSMCDRLALPHGTIWNTVFRAVHDWFGHYHGRRCGFGEKGEALAWLKHRAMFFNPDARLALFNETIAQSAWVYANRGVAGPMVFAPQHADIPSASLEFATAARVSAAL
jgi:hypothetical protein